MKNLILLFAMAIAMSCSASPPGDINEDVNVIATDSEAISLVGYDLREIDSIFIAEKSQYDSILINEAVEVPIDEASPLQSRMQKEPTPLCNGDSPLQSRMQKEPTPLCNGDSPSNLNTLTIPPEKEGYLNRTWTSVKGDSGD